MDTDEEFGEFTEYAVPDRIRRLKNFDKEKLHSYTEALSMFESFLEEHYDLHYERIDDNSTIPPPSLESLYDRLRRIEFWNSALEEYDRLQLKLARKEMLFNVNSSSIRNQLLNSLAMSSNLLPISGDAKKEQVTEPERIANEAQSIPSSMLCVQNEHSIATRSYDSQCRQETIPKSLGNTGIFSQSNHLEQQNLNIQNKPSEGLSGISNEILMDVRVSEKSTIPSEMITRKLTGFQHPRIPDKDLSAVVQSLIDNIPTLNINKA